MLVWVKVTEITVLLDNIASQYWDISPVIITGSYKTRSSCWASLDHSLRPPSHVLLQQRPWWLYQKEHSYSCWTSSLSLVSHARVWSCAGGSDRVFFRCWNLHFQVLDPVSENTVRCWIVWVLECMMSDLRMVECWVMDIRASVHMHFLVSL